MDPRSEEAEVDSNVQGQGSPYHEAQEGHFTSRLGSAGDIAPKAIASQTEGGILVAPSEVPVAALDVKASSSASTPWPDVQAESSREQGLSIAPCTSIRDWATT